MENTELHGSAAVRDLSLDQTYLDTIVEMMKKRQIQPVRRDNTPKNIRYLLIASGAFIKLVAGGTTFVWQLLQCLSAYGIGELLIRLSFLKEELKPIHVSTRYDNDKRKVIDRVLGSKLDITCFLASIVLPFISNEIGWSLFSTIVLGRLVLSVTDFERNPFIVFREIGGRHSGLFYGNSMAYSYFHGYLDIILPDHGHEGEKHFQERIEEYVDSNASEDGSRRIDVPDKKLYILIPSSGEAPAKVSHNAKNWMEEAHNLEHVIRNRGGVKKRKYHNTMYRIKDPNDHLSRPQYVVTEYATPLITYHEACNHSSSDESWRNFKRDTVISFYETCQDILNQNRSCRNKVELVYFDDKNELGNDVNVAKVLLERMKAAATRNNDDSD